MPDVLLDDTTVVTTTAVHPREACSCGSGAVLSHLVEPPTEAASIPAASPPAYPANAPRPGLADVILVGRIRTMNGAQPLAEAVAVTDGVITAVGRLDEIEGLKGPRTEVVTADGGAILPGLIEPHMHYWPSALFLDWVDCSTRVGTTFADVLAYISRAAPVQGDWVLGQAFDPSLCDGRKELDRDVLDEVCPDRPCLVMNASMHFAYANSKALALAGIHRDTPDPHGGYFGRDSTGRLNGVIGEEVAIQRILEVVPRAAAGLLAANILRINERATSKGYTRAHDANTGLILGADKEVALLHKLSPRFTGRVTYAVADRAMDAALESGLTPFAGDDMCRATSWKFTTDGSNQGFSGFQRENYLGQDFRGRANYAFDTLTARMRKAHDLGWQIMSHANGDAAIDLTLDAYQAALAGSSGSALRHRIEHCSFAHPGQLDRMVELGLSPSFLIGHLYYWGDAFVNDIMGREKCQLLDPVRSALTRGLHPTTHSDYTVTDFEPFREIQTQVTRQMRVSGEVLNPDERLDVHSALRTKTIDAAWQTHSDQVAGSIEVGKFADFTIVDRDPLDVAPDDIADTVVTRTIVGGRTVYRA